MDSTNGPGKRGSALPRTKLPTPGSGIPKAPTALKSSPAATSSHGRAQSQAGFAIPQRPLQHNVQAPLTSHAKPPTTSAQAEPGKHERQTSATSTASSRSQYTRHNSLQSDQTGDGPSSEESEITPDTPLSPASNGGSLKLPRRPRPSLSDRAIESLGNISPSPINERRRSSFFSPQSPMTPQRPPPSDKIGTASKINFSGVKGRNTIGRPSSPTKSRPTSIYGTVPPRRAMSTNLARPASAASNGRPTSPSKPRANTGLPGKTSTGRPMSIIGSPFASRPNGTQTPKTTTTSSTTRPALSTRPPSTSATPRDRPLSIVKTSGIGLRNRGQTPVSPRPVTSATPKPPQPSRDPETTPSELNEPLEETKSSSSSTLRQQIAEAKAKARNAQPALKERDEAATSYDFESCDDPFGTKPKDGKDELRKRIDDARRHGRLNIAAMSFSSIPEEVLCMYDSEAMEASSVPWSETVDLTRLNAADNEIAELEDGIFPDVSPADMAETEDGKGSQFGGLEHIDLHGNQLHRVPQGLRQLNRLTSLNLARNKLTSDVFGVITQIPTLFDLDLSNNALEHDIPSTIGRLSLLDKLDLSNNKISILPSSLRDLGRLRNLSVSHNRLQSLPFEALAKMQALRELTASHNAFSGALIPSSVTELPHLRVLDVSNNACASLTFSRILKLPALVRLDISSNRLGMFKDISEWSSLTTLIADDNCLREMPQGMIKLTQKLRVVSVERNSIPNVPEEIADMEALETLNLAGNPLYERRLVSLDAQGIKHLMMDKRELSHKMNGNRIA